MIALIFVAGVVVGALLSAWALLVAGALRANKEAAELRRERLSLHGRAQ